jgi:hypothetical protein
MFDSEHLTTDTPEMSGESTQVCAASGSIDEFEAGTRAMGDAEIDALAAIGQTIVP